MWWTRLISMRGGQGLVMSVVGEKYTVGFKSPPDLLELGRGDPTAALGLARRRVESGPERDNEPSDFQPWDDVEVNLHKDRIWYSWIPATYVGPLGDNCFLVQYKSVYNCDENGFVKKVVSDHQIRPRLPQQEERAFGLMTMVDAYHEMCWWVGDVKKMLTGDKYIVTFRFSKHEKKFNKSDLRLHMEWIGSEWVTVPKALEDKIVSEETSKYASSYRNSSKERTPGSTKSRTKQSTLLVDESPYGNAKNKLKSCQHHKDGAPVSSPTPSKKLKGEHSEDSLPLANLIAKTTPDKPPNKRRPFRDGEDVGQVDSETRTQVKKSGRQRKSEVDSPSPSVRLGKKARTARSQKSPGKKSSRIDKEFEQVEHVINGIISSNIGSELEVMGGSHAGSSSVLLKVDNQHPKNGDISGIIVMALPEFHVKHSKDLTASSEDPVRDGPAIPSVLEIQQAVSGIPAKEVGHSIKTMEGTTNHQNEVRGGHHENDVNGDIEREDNPNFPFLKSLPLWKNIESMDVLKKFPQNPHFQPLLKQEEVFREGSALGKMIAFTSLVDQTSKLRVDDPRDVIDSNLEATVELELHGFDVDAMKHRLTELLGLKVKLEELHSQSKVIESNIIVSSHNRIKDTEMVEKLDKQIEELQKKRVVVVSTCACSQGFRD